MSSTSSPPTARPKKPHVLVVHGPNLNLLGTREPDIYGSTTLDQINTRLNALAQAHDCTLSALQSNHEGGLVDALQQARGRADYIIINPAAFTHTSVAIRDCLAAMDTPFIEVHLSNIYQREPFRQHSYFSDKAVGVICGLGAEGYVAALRFVLQKLNRWTSEN
jgi:3-dehydroquinate dehydratase II